MSDRQRREWADWKRQQPHDPDVCALCEGAGEIEELLGQDRWSGLLHTKTWICPDCNGSGEPQDAKDNHDAA